MLDQRRCPVGFEVISADTTEMNVGAESKCPKGVYFSFLRPCSSRISKARGDGHGEEDSQRCRKNAPGAASIKAPERDAAFSSGFADQEPRDEEAGDHEEDIHADEATAGPPHEVVEHNQQDRHGTKTLDVRSERARAVTAPSDVYDAQQLLGGSVLRVILTSHPRRRQPIRIPALGEQACGCVWPVLAEATTQSIAPQAHAWPGAHRDTAVGRTMPSTNRARLARPSNGHKQPC